MTPRERIMAAARLQAETGGDPSFAPASDPQLCAIFGWTQTELDAVRTDARGEVTVWTVGDLTVRINPHAVSALTFDPSPAVYAGPLGALRPVQR